VNSFDVPPNHRLLATIDALVFLFGATGLLGISAKARNDAVNRHLAGLGKSKVSDDVVRHAMRILRAGRGSSDRAPAPALARSSVQMLDDPAGQNER
jgi:hypothetical protein